MDNTEIKELITNLKDKSNTELAKNLDILNDEFNITKNMVINLTYKLDDIEEVYDLILKEYNKRTNVKQ
jgi:hypothetical protein